MQSQLTRRVFRAILNNEPLISSRCRNRCLHTVRSSRPRRIVPGPSFVQRRALFAFNFGAPSTPQESTLPSEVGLKEMRDLSVSLETKSRVPESDMLTKAYQDFFETRADQPGIITHMQAQLLRTTWNYLEFHKAELDSEEWSRVFSDESLGNILYVLSKAECLPPAHPDIRKIARSVFTTLCEVPQFGKSNLDQLAIHAYIDVQALLGDPEEARQTLESFWDTLEKPGQGWLPIMKGYAKGRFDEKLFHVARRISFNTAYQKEMFDFLIEHDLFTAVKLVYDCLESGKQTPSLSTKLTVMKYAIMRSKPDLARRIFDSIRSDRVLETIEIRLLLDAVEGKDASQISRVVESLAAKEPALKQSITISCVNDLIQYANSTNNPKLASEFLELASAWDLIPNEQTQFLYLESLVQAGNVNAVLECLADMDTMEMHTKPLPLMNKLITMLSLSNPNEAVFDRISSLLDPLLEDNMRLEAPTLAALTHMLLYRHDLEAVSELLRPRLGSYDDDGRFTIRKPIEDFIKDLNQDSEPTWAAYMLLRLAFPESGVRIRTSIMTTFFQRNRSDLAFLVFGHMRQSESFGDRPKADTYTHCFRGLAHTQDAKNLELVSNMLKLDTEVDLDTRLLNWLMLAHAECGSPDKSMQVFREILQHDEGPSPQTILFFFRVCETHHNGTDEAMKMLEKMKHLDIDIDRRLYTAYVEALAVQCEFDLATEALNVMGEVTGIPPQMSTIGYFYNAIGNQSWKDEVETWAKAQYPALWNQLETSHEREETEEGLRFKLRKRDLTRISIDGMWR